MTKNEFSITLDWFRTVNQYNIDNATDLIENLEAFCEVTNDTEIKDIEAYSVMLLKLVENVKEGFERINKAMDFYEEEFKKGNIKINEDGINDNGTEAAGQD